jgi:hypothetical protein
MALINWYFFEFYQTMYSYCMWQFWQFPYNITTIAMKTRLGHPDLMVAHKHQLAQYCSLKSCDIKTNFITLHAPLLKKQHSIHPCHYKASSSLIIICKWKCKLTPCSPLSKTKTHTHKESKTDLHGSLSAKNPTIMIHRWGGGFQRHCCCYFLGCEMEIYVKRVMVSYVVSCMYVMCGEFSDNQGSSTTIWNIQ